VLGVITLQERATVSFPLDRAGAGAMIGMCQRLEAEIGVRLPGPCA
jgi:hypothetical protein